MYYFNAFPCLSEHPCTCCAWRCFNFLLLVAVYNILGLLPVLQKGEKRRWKILKSAISLNLLKSYQSWGQCAIAKEAGTSIVVHASLIGSLSRRGNLSLKKSYLGFGKQGFYPQPGLQTMLIVPETYAQLSALELRGGSVYLLLY